MKKLLFFLLVTLLAACSNDTTAPADTGNSNAGQYSKLVYNASNIIHSGQNLLETSLRFYTGITNLRDIAIVKALADYNLFPVGFDTVDKFQERVKLVLGGAQRTNNVNDLLNQFITSGHGHFHQIDIGGSSKRRANDNPFITDPIVGATAFDKDARDFVKNSIVSFAKGAILASPPVVELLNMFGLSSKDTFRDEVRASLKRIEDKLKEIQLTTSQILHEVTILSAAIPAYINYNAIVTIKNRYMGALQNYAQAATQSLGMMSLSNYFLIGEFNSDLQSFITFAKEYRTYTATTNKNIYVADAPYCSTNKGRCFQVYESKSFRSLPIGIEIVDNPTTKIQLPGFTNPQKILPISYGDLETIGHMMLTRLRCNALFFSGETLKNNNRTLAQTYIQQLQEFKNAANNMYSEGYTILNNWQICYTNTFPCQVVIGSGLIASSSSPGWTAFNNDPPFFMASTHYTFSTYNSSPQSSFTPSTTLDQIHTVNHIPYNNSLGRDPLPVHGDPQWKLNSTTQPTLMGNPDYIIGVNDIKATWNAIKLKFEDERRRAMMEYLNPFIARLIAIETLLRSYL